MTKQNKVIFGAAALFVLAGLGAIFVLSGAAERAAAQMPGGDQGPMPVSITVIEPKPVRIWREFPGRLSAVDYAEIRPQVSGRIQEIRFQDGQMVEAGDVLFVIDPRPYETALDQAKALLEGARSHYALAEKELQRAEELIKTNAISKRIYDERANGKRLASAEIEGAKAQVEKAKIDLDYAYVKAPISGKTGRAEMTVGNLVQAGPSAPLLTSIVSNEGIYADFEVDEQTYLAHIWAGQQSAMGPMQPEKIPVEIILRGDGDQVLEGFIHSFDNRIDPSSGTIRARALFENKDGALLPGMFAKIRLGGASEDEQIVLTEKAISTDQNRKFVYVVGDDNMVAYREVQLGENTGGNRVILSGLNAGDRVIDDGIIKIRPGMPVKPMEKNAPDAEMPPPQSNPISDL